MDVDNWLAAAQQDAERRNLPELKPILQGLATATRQLRAAPWNDDASGREPRQPLAKTK